MVNHMLNPIHPQDLNKLTHARAGEEKLGQVIHLIQDLEEELSEAGPFVLIGIPEDIGVRANLGRPGAASSLESLFSALFNVQINRHFSPELLSVAGSIAVEDLMEKAAGLQANVPADLAELRQLTEQVDQRVKAVLKPIFQAGKVPIVVGGGHNNAYGIISACAMTMAEGIPVLNIDPHADFRAMEGRHSGNGFRYAMQEGSLRNYAVFGLHESYNNEEILQEFHQNSQLYYQSFDELLSYPTDQGMKLFKDVLNWLGPDRLGLEVDLDSLAHFPVSAYAASGFQLEDLRRMVSTAAQLHAPYYLHLAETAPTLASHSDAAAGAGKALVYLLIDFIKAHPYGLDAMRT